MPIYPPYSAHFDGNQVPTQMGVAGTLGTADTGGTATPLPFAVEPESGAAFTQALSLRGTILSTAIAVGITVTAIPTTALTDRKSLIAYNDGTATVYIGGATVTAGTGSSRGISIGTSAWTPSLDIGTTILYAIGATVGGTLVILEVS